MVGSGLFEGVLWVLLSVFLLVCIVERVFIFFLFFVGNGFNFDGRVVRYEWE